MFDKDVLANRLTQLRMQRGCSARDMSLSLGQSESYINKIENGRTLPSLPALGEICDYLGITIVEFFDSGNPAPERLREMIDDLKRLDAETLAHVGLLVKDVLSKKS